MVITKIASHARLRPGSAGNATDDTPTAD